MSRLLRLREPMRQHGLWRLWLALWTIRNRVVRFVWSADNWRQGYKFGAVQRFRCCDHTTPFHSEGCGNVTESQLGDSGQPITETQHKTACEVSDG